MGRTAWALAGILFLLVFEITLVQAQSLPASVSRSDNEAALRGVVTDASNGLPLPGANVLLQDSKGDAKGSVANQDGFYLIGGLAPGVYHLQASFIGFEVHADTLIIEAGSRITRHIALAPTSKRLQEVVIAAESGAGRMRGGLQTVRSAGIRRIPAPDASGDSGLLAAKLARRRSARRSGKSTICPWRHTCAEPCSGRWSGGLATLSYRRILFGVSARSRVQRRFLCGGIRGALQRTPSPATSGTAWAFWAAPSAGSARGRDW